MMDRQIDRFLTGRFWTGGFSNEGVTPCMLVSVLLHATSYCTVQTVKSNQGV